MCGMSELGERLSELRLDNQEEQKDVAALLHLTAASISNYENGRHLPTADSLVILANHYDVTTDYLMGRTDCRLSISVLNTMFVKQITYGKLIEKLVELPPSKRTILCELIDDMYISNFIRKQSEDKEGSKT